MSMIFMNEKVVEWFYLTTYLPGNGRVNVFLKHHIRTMNLSKKKTIALV